VTITAEPDQAVALPDATSQNREAGTSIELFTGGGGLAIAMHNARFRHLLAVELDKRACATLRRNKAIAFDPDGAPPTHLDDKWPLIERDVHKVDFTPWLGEVDVIAGGVPCQPWSLGGAHRGYDDHRNLWPELFRAVRETRPLAVIAENVKGLLRPSFKPYYEYIINELKAPFEQRGEGEDWRDHQVRLTKALEAEGSDLTERYDVTYHLVNAADYGVPQVRWRVFVVAFRKDLDVGEWSFPEPSHSELALLHAQDSGEYWSEHALRPRPESVSETLLQFDGKTERWRTLRDAIRGLPEPVGVKEENPPWLHHCFWPGAREYPGHTPNDLDLPAKTVKAGVHGVPGGETVMRKDDGTIRYMTVRETARVMTFPDDWRLEGPRGEQMRQLGNAVPVRLAETVADAVAETIRRNRGSAERGGRPDDESLA
jgi:DNA (cytosine-5)-methyltransferase 1